MTPYTARLEFARMSPAALSARLAEAIHNAGRAWTIGFVRLT